ncbi:MAG: cytochrome c oxidase assembly factor 1 family protein [Acidobacteriota bacterium]|nr:cytochrome c oxidase assembly factor 1 family protein [Acidobacteriota bacterium]
MGTPPAILPPATPAQIPPQHPGWWSRNWKWFVPVGCLTLIALFAALLAGIVLIVSGSMKSSDAYKLALDKAQHDARVQQRLGTPIEAGMFASGNINVAGSAGEAGLTIPISGPKGKGTIYVDATKFAGEWKFNRLEVGFDGDEQRVDLLTPPAAASPPDH